MPPKIHQLIKELKNAGFKQTRSKGSHRRFEHKSGCNVTLSGKAGADAHHYQLAQVADAIAEVMNEKQ